MCNFFSLFPKKKTSGVKFFPPPVGPKSEELDPGDKWRWSRLLFFSGRFLSSKVAVEKLNVLWKVLFFVERCVIMGAYVWYGFLITIWCIFILFWDIFTFYISAYVHMLITALSNVNLHDGQGSPDSNLVNGKHTGHHSTNKPTKTLQRTQMQPQPAAYFPHSIIA